MINFDLHYLYTCQQSEWSTQQDPQLGGFLPCIAPQGSDRTVMVKIFVEPDEIVSLFKLVTFIIMQVQLINLPLMIVGQNCWMSSF